MSEPKKTVMVSGGFDPIHPGHIRLINDAASYGNVLVALNSDAWLERKKGFCFQGWIERMEVLAALRNVRGVIGVDDQDGTVCAALRQRKPDYFANGGDRSTVNTPELSVCAELGIEPLFGIGGDIKKYSSSLIAPKRIVQKPWGEYVTMAEGDGYAVKLLKILPGHRISLQRHHFRSERWTVLNGRADVLLGNNLFVLEPGHECRVEIDVWHRLRNIGHAVLEVLEIQKGHILDESDIQRADDDYSREPVIVTTRPNDTEQSPSVRAEGFKPLW